MFHAKKQSLTEFQPVELVHLQFRGTLLNFNSNLSQTGKKINHEKITSSLLIMISTNSKSFVNRMTKCIFCLVLRVQVNF